MDVEETGSDDDVQELEIQSSGTPRKRDIILYDPSPRCILEIPISGSDSDDNSSSSLDSYNSSSNEKFVHQKLASMKDSPANTNSLHNGKRWKHAFEAIKRKSLRSFSVIPLLSTHKMVSKKNMMKKLARIQHSAEMVIDSTDMLIDCSGIPVPKPSWRNFDYAELAAATDNFSDENLIGEGGHANVYKGYLSDGQVVAVKKLIKTQQEEEDGIATFLSELGTIAHINHPNAARLLGFSIEGGLYLVLEYLPNGSLASKLHGESECLDWKRRFKVAVGIAQGLQYLHQDCPRRIIHRDIKASNVLLGEDYEAQISDFGLAKWLPENSLQHIVYPIEGTFGYLAPEYFMHGIVDEKTDVFAFGVLLLEIITGHRAVDSKKQSLVLWAKPLLEANNAKQLADPRLGDDYDPSEMQRAMLMASLCIDHQPTMRPTMSQVVQLLKREENPLESNQTYSGRRLLFDGNDLQDDNCTAYLDNLTPHMQLVLE